jgi:SAM-dependent methyltransferase
MEAPSHKHLRIWDQPTLTIVHEAPARRADAAPLAGPHNPVEFAERLYAHEALDPVGGVAPADEGAEPYTLQWFLSIENQRHSRQGRWIPRLLEFAKHSGETLLGLGDGLGTDWLQYARHGAAVVVCSPSGEQLALIRRNFELRGLAGRFLQSAPTSLPLESATIDVACISNLLQEAADPAGVVQEVYRVLKPGGKVLAVTAARYDVEFWTRACFPWLRWVGWERRGVSPPVPAGPPGQFSARGLSRLFDAFIEHRVHKRQLRRSEVPHLWRWLPLSLLERLMGHVLVLKAFKPLSAAINVPLAA